MYLNEYRWKQSNSLFPYPKIVGFWPAGFILLGWIQAFLGLISAKSWVFLDASKNLVLICKGFWKKWVEKAHFERGPRVESPRFEWTWKQARREIDDDVRVDSRTFFD